MKDEMQYEYVVRAGEDLVEARLIEDGEFVAALVFDSEQIKLMNALVSVASKKSG
jgi:hypothetical protein